MNEEHEHMERCPACGNPVDYCLGHGRNADPVGWGIVTAHHLDAHTRCHPGACDLGGRR